MGDLISRNEAAKRLEDLAKKREGSYSGEAFEFAAKVVRGVPAAEVPHWATEQAYKNGYEDGKLKWISVRDRLPEDASTVLAIDSDGTISSAYYVGRWHSGGDLDEDAVIHWMPLPQPPKGD